LESVAALAAVGYNDISDVKYFVEVDVGDFTTFTGLSASYICKREQPGLNI
jgi:hypothetical protein